MTNGVRQESSKIPAMLHSNDNRPGTPAIVRKLKTGWNTEAGVEVVRTKRKANNQVENAAVKKTKT